MFKPKLFSLIAATLLTCACAIPASADDNMATPAAQSSAMTGRAAPMKPATAHQKKTTKPMAKAGAMSTTAGMSTAAMGGKSSDHMAAKPADTAMKGDMSSH